MHAMKPILPAVLALCTVFATTAVAAMKIMPLGDSITEGLCSDGSDTNTAASTCYVPYYEPQNAAIYNHYDTESTFCGEFARHMVEDFNHGASGGYRGLLLMALRGAGMIVDYVGHVHSGNALATGDRAHEAEPLELTQPVGRVMARAVQEMAPPVAPEQLPVLDLPLRPGQMAG